MGGGRTGRAACRACVLAEIAEPGARGRRPDPVVGGLAVAGAGPGDRRQLHSVGVVPGVDG